jgi:hypothetical protein
MLHRLALSPILRVCGAASLLVTAGEIRVPAQQTAGQPIRLEASEKLLALLAAWRPGISFFTTNQEPIQSLDDLKEAEFAYAGAELAERARQMSDLLWGIYPPRKLREVSPALWNQKMESRPKLLLASERLGSQLDGVVPIVFVKLEAGSITGTLVDDAKKLPFKKFHLALYRFVRGNDGKERVIPVNSVGGVIQILTATSNESGRFSFTEVPSGDWVIAGGGAGLTSSFDPASDSYVRFSVSGIRNTPGGLLVVSIAKGQALDLGTVVVTRK